MVSTHELDLVGCTKWTSGVEDCFSTARVMGDLLWGTLEAWPSTTWTVLSGPDPVFSRPMAMGVTFDPEQVNCTKWTSMTCYGVTLKPGLVLCGLH